jgi:hypothetical protein
MTERETMPTHFIEPIRCPHCTEMSYIIRRRGDAFGGDGSEVWSFQCVNGHNTEKSGRR